MRCFPAPRVSISETTEWYLNGPEMRGTQKTAVEFLRCNDVAMDSKTHYFHKADLQLCSEFLDEY